MAKFVTPPINDNSEGWGPPPDLPPAKFRDMPYAPFSKSDRLGRAADWTTNNRYHQGDSADGAGEDDASFTIVDNFSTHRSTGGGFYRRGGFQSRGRGGYSRGGYQYDNRSSRYNDIGPGSSRGGYSGGRGGSSGSNSRGGYYRRPYEDRRIIREPSVEVQPDWDLVQETSFSDLSKMSHSLPGGRTAEPENLVSCGQLRFYDRTADRITCRTPKPLEKVSERYTFRNVTTTDDPVIRRIAASGVGSVFITSHILALLMSSTRSAYPWDIVVQRVGDKLFFDKRDGSIIDFWTVNETAYDPPRDEVKVQADGTTNAAAVRAANSAEEASGIPTAINTFQALALEATLINQNFSQAVIDSKGSGMSMDESSPFEADAGEQLPSVAYLYKKWQLTDEVAVVVRTEVDAALSGTSPGEKPKLLVVKALSETMDARQPGNWRSRLDSQRGAVLATELKNNAGKLARWTAQAILADADQMKLGFVSRVTSRKNTDHLVLGTQMSKPRDFAAQINLNVGNMWGVFKYLVDVCYKHVPENGGKAVITKDPNAPTLRIYRVPEDAFEEEDDDDEDEAKDDSEDED